MNYYEAQLEARRIAEQTGMTLAEIVSLPMDEFARLTRGQTPAEAARAAITAQYEQEQPPAPAVPQSPPQPPAPQPQGVDIRNLSMDDYAVLRAQLGLDKARQDRGIFGSGRATADAARFQAGRTAMSRANVQEPPRIERAYIQQDDYLDGRSAGQRFSTPGNLNQF